MNTKLLKRARKLWSNPYAPTHTNRHNQLQWARSVHRLGDKWLLAKHVQRKDEGGQ